MATRRRSTQDPPEDYQLSRAALRDRYGTRQIDARAPQSALDYTPSGRQKFLEQQSARQGIAPAEVAAPNQVAIQARQQVGQEFKNQFKPTQQVAPVPQPAQLPMISRQSRRQPFQGGVASPEDVGMVRAGGGKGTLQTPYGSVTLGLLPETAAPDQLSEFLPTASPLTGFALPKLRPTFLGSPLPSRFSRYG